MNTLKNLVLVSLVLIVACTGLSGCGCGGDSNKQGEEGGSCFPNNTCNEGLVCLSKLCVRLGQDGGQDASDMDVGHDAAMDAGYDAGTDAGQDSGGYYTPTVTSISPSTGVNSDSVNVSVGGTNFKLGATVKLTATGLPDISATSVTVKSYIELACTFDLTGQAVGPRNVVVTNDDARSGTLPNGFTLTYAVPTISAITPNTGLNNGPVSITDLHGTYFRTGATVKMTKSGQPDISATNVNVVSATKITCDFDLTGVKVGGWNVVVTNDDAKSGILTDGFMVNYPAAPVITSIEPNSVDFSEPVIDISNLAGTGFQPGATVRLTKTGQADVAGTNITVVGSTKITCTFDLTGKELGQWDVVVTNNDTQSGILPNGFGFLNQCGAKNDFTLCALRSPKYKYNICIQGICVMPGCGDATCNPPGPNFPITPETGSHYTRNTSVTGYPVVHDVITGLDWQGCAAGLTGDNCGTGTALTKSWANALAYCNDLDWGGHTDWRLSNPDELVSIVNYGRSNPAIDVTAFPNTTSDYFWTSWSYVLDIWGSRWLVGATYGDNLYGDKLDGHYIRCVRGEGQNYLSRFERSFPGPTDQPMVKDNVTGLTWQGCVAGLSGGDCMTGTVITRNWNDAGTYCAGLDWGGKSTGWRLPNIKELTGLVDGRNYSPSIDTAAFPNTPTSQLFWSSSSLIVNSTDAWYVEFTAGAVGMYGKSTGISYVRCVRDIGEMVTVPAGAFQMGCNSAVDTECESDGRETPYHSVTVPTFKIDKYEVTAAQYKACVTASGCSAADTGSGCNYNVSGKESHPINCVDWSQAKTYCTWAGKRLPTEAEWEKAARGTDGRKYPWGNTGLDCDHAVMSVSPCSNSGTAQVGSKPLGVSPYGAMDMLGNVWEWTEDDYHSTYTGAPTDGSAWIDSPRGTYRVVRGGSWFNTLTSTFRASKRFDPIPTSDDSHYGFRCAQ